VGEWSFEGTLGGICECRVGLAEWDERGCEVG
jgi:hypothetical protein